MTVQLADLRTSKIEGVCWKYGLGFPQTSEWAGWMGNKGFMTWYMSVEVLDTGTDW